MKKLINSVTNLRLKLGKIMAVLLLGTVVMVTTACDNRTDQVSSRSIESPVQFNGKIAKGLIYSDSPNEPKSLKSKNDFVSPQEQKKLLDPAQIPAEKQPIFNRFDRNAKLLEKTSQMFEDAKATPDFIQDSQRQK